MLNAWMPAEGYVEKLLPVKFGMLLVTGELGGVVRRSGAEVPEVEIWEKLSWQFLIVARQIPVHALVIGNEVAHRSPFRPGFEFTTIIDVWEQLLPNHERDESDRGTPPC